MKLFHACFFDSMLTWPFSSTHFWLSIRDASCFHSQDFSVGVGSSSPDPILDIHTSYKNVLGCKSWVHVWKRTALRVFHVTELLFHAVEKALSGNVGLVGSIYLSTFLMSAGHFVLLLLLPQGDAWTSSFPTKVWRLCETADGVKTEVKGSGDNCKQSLKQNMKYSLFVAL